MVQSELMLVELGQNCTDIKVRIGLDLWSLQTGLNSQGLLQEIECSTHFSYASIIASHIIKGHSHAKFIGLTKLLRLLKQIESAINILLLQVINC